LRKQAKAGSTIFWDELEPEKKKTTGFIALGTYYTVLVLWIRKPDPQGSETFCRIRIRNSSYGSGSKPGTEL
jgi:hypothetical protein